MNSLMNKYRINSIMLFLCPFLLLAQSEIAFLTGENNYLLYYAWIALIVYLLLMYIPTHTFISKNGEAKSFGFGLPRVSVIIWAAVLGVGVSFFTTALQQACAVFFNWLGVNISLFKLETAPISGGIWWLPAIVALYALIPAYCEETLFRGALLFSWLPHGKSRAILHSAFLFSLICFNPPALPALFAGGLLLGYVAVKSGSCLLAVLMSAIDRVIAALITFGLPLISPAAADRFYALDNWVIAGVFGLAGLVLIAIGLPGLCCCLKRNKDKPDKAEKAVDVIDPEIKTGVISKKIKKLHIELEENSPPHILAANKVFRKWTVPITYAFLIFMNIFLLALVFSSISAP